MKTLLRNTRDFFGYLWHWYVLPAFDVKFPPPPRQERPRSYDRGQTLDDD